MSEAKVLMFKTRKDKDLDRLLDLIRQCDERKDFWIFVAHNGDTQETNLCVSFDAEKYHSFARGLLATGMAAIDQLHPIRIHPDPDTEPLEW